MVSEGCVSSSLNACAINAPKKVLPLLSGVASPGDAITLAIGQVFHQGPVSQECLGFALLELC